MKKKKKKNGTSSFKSISDDRFSPLSADKNFKTVQLMLYVFKRMCKRIKCWLAIFLPFPAVFNLSTLGS